MQQLLQLRCNLTVAQNIGGIHMDKYEFYDFEKVEALKNQRARKYMDYVRWWHAAKESGMLAYWAKKREFLLLYALASWGAYEIISFPVLFFPKKPYIFCLKLILFYRALWRMSLSNNPQK